MPQKLYDLPDSFGNGGKKIRDLDSNAQVHTIKNHLDFRTINSLTVALPQAVPLAFISYEDKSALKDGKQKK